MADDGLLGIGRMARLSGLTAKALRHYDRIGLLRPAVVEESTGIRRYADTQLPAARLIFRLRSVDIPLDEIRRCLADQTVVREVLLAHRTKLESRLARITGDLHDIAHFLNDGLDNTMTDKKSPVEMSPEDERRLAIWLFNSTWDLMETEVRTRDDDDRMLHMAHASRYHWGQVGAPVNRARGEWQCSRVYAVLRRPEPCLYHAQRVLDICQEYGIADFDLAFAYEALARGHAVAGDSEMARDMTERALRAAEDIAEDGERKIVLDDLETIPGQPRFW